MPYDTNPSQQGPTYETYQKNRVPYAHQLPPTDDNKQYSNNYANQQNQAIGFGSSYTLYNNNVNKPQTPNQYFLQFQPQQIQNSFNPFYNTQQAQTQQPFKVPQQQQPPPPQQSLFVNPFQPFLQQTYQVTFNKLCYPF